MPLLKNITSDIKDEKPSDENERGDRNSPESTFTQNVQIKVSVNSFGAKMQST